MSTYITIGHSTHVIGELISILLTEKMRWSSTFVLSLALALTRSLTAETLPITLAEQGI